MDWRQTKTKHNKARTTWVIYGMNGMPKLILGIKMLSCVMKNQKIIKK